MSTLDGWTLTFGPQVKIVTETCFKCGVLFGMEEGYQAFRKRKGDTFYCPNGHGQIYTETAEARLRRELEAARAKQVHTEDQLFATAVDLERMRGLLLRDRARFARGVCPCCNRSFSNVLGHMTSEHPEYDVTRVEGQAAPEFKCSCHRTFRSLGGLHKHQTARRWDDWYKSSAGSWGQHLTVVS